MSETAHCSTITLPTSFSTAEDYIVTIDVIKKIEPVFPVQITPLAETQFRRALAMISLESGSVAR